MTPADVRFLIMGTLVALDEGESLHRRVINELVNGTDKYGAELTYGSLGWLKTKGWIEDRPWSREMFRCTPAGREAWQVASDFRKAVA